MNLISTTGPTGAPCASVEVLAAGAAFLQALGCPAAGQAGPLSTGWLPAGSADRGVAVTVPVVLDRDHSPHAATCPAVTQRQPVTVAALETMTRGRRCKKCGNTTWLAVAPSALPVDAVADLARRLSELVAGYPPVTGSAVIAERRAWRFGAGVADTVGRFTDRHALPAGLEDALTRYAAAARGTADGALGALRRDGLHRLECDLAVRFHRLAAHSCADDAAAAIGRSSVVHAERAVAGFPGDRVACLFRGIDPMVDTVALAAAEAAESTGPWEWALTRNSHLIAAAVVPRRLAVYLHAEFTSRAEPGASAPAVFSQVVAPGLTGPQLRQACAAALLVWGGSDCEPHQAWRTAEALCR